MKKMKKCSKGFTLTELAVVIAVIAILIAVLVPTFISILDSANVSADKQLVKNLNTALSIEGTTGNIETPADALDAVAESGYSVDKLETESDSEIIYDQVTNTFALLAEGKVTYPENSGIDVNASTTWYFASSQSEIAENATVSYILTGEWGSSQASTHSAQTAKTSVKNAAATTVTGAAVTYSGEGGIDTSRASGIATVNYEYKGTATGATVILNITSGSLYIELSSTSGTVTINNYSSEEVTTAVSGSSSSATVSLNNVNGSACYVETAVSGKVTYSGNEDSYSVVASVDNSTGTVEVGSEAYPYLLASEEDLAKKMSYGGYYLVTESFTSTTAVTIASGTEVILDLGGYTLTISGYVADYNCALLNDGVLTINNGTLNVFASYTYGGIKNYGTVTVNSGATVNGYFAAIYNRANVNIYGTVISNQYNNTTNYSYSKAIYNSSGTINIYDGAYIYGYYGIYTFSTVNVNGGEISGTYGINSYGGNIAISGEAKVNGSYRGVLIGSSSNSTTGVVTYGTLNMTGGTVSGGTYGIYTAGTTTITGGDISSSSMGIRADGGTLTIGSLNANNSEINIIGEYMALYLSSGVVCDLYSGTLSASYGIGCWGFSSDAYTILSIYGGAITGTDGFAVCGNGTTGQGYDKIYIYGGTLTSTNAQAIYNPQQEGETYIYGGTISGTSGIEIRNGYVYIGEVDGETVDPLYIKATYNPSDTESNNSGSTTAGAAIAISAYNLVDITVIVGEGTYEGFYSLYEFFVNGSYDNDNNLRETPLELTVSITIDVTDGTFKGTVYSQNVIDFISGGSYTLDTNLSNYLASGYQIPETATNGYFVVSEGTTVTE